MIGLQSLMAASQEFVPSFCLVESVMAYLNRCPYGVVRILLVLSFYQAPMAFYLPLGRLYLASLAIFQSY